MKNEYRNPRTFAGFDDWPYGRRFKTRCEFTVETLDINGSHKERVSKMTINPKTGRPNKPKKTTFAPACRIVDSSDGKTYIIYKSGYGPSIYVKKWDFYDHESIQEGDERYYRVLALFDEVEREREAEINHNMSQEESEQIDCIMKEDRER